MKHALTTLALALAAFSAAAQDAAPQSPAAPATADRPAAAANPFTGKPLNTEALQRELELRKMQSALLEEQLRAMNLEEETRYVAGRKQAEAAVAGTALARERLAQANLERELTAAKAPPATRPDAALRTPKKTVKVEEDKQAAPRVVAPSRPSINVLSVLNTKGKRSAMLEIGSDVVSVEDGQQTPYGIVHVNEQGVRIDNQSLAVSDSTIGRVRRPENEQPQQQRTGVMGVGMQTASVQPTANQSVSQLPPLVLPPTVRAPTAVPGQNVAPATQATVPAAVPISIR